MKQGILIVSFGTTYQETREKNIEALVADVRQAYPDAVVLQAYTSNVVRKKLRERDGIEMFDVVEGLSQMHALQVTSLRVLSTHIVDGVEHHKVKRIVEAHRSLFQTVHLSGALLEKEEDYVLVAKALWDGLKEACSNHVLILMGHGTHMRADVSYETLEHTLRRYAKEEIYIATVEGSITIADVVAKMNARWGSVLPENKPSVIITPLMLVAGDHAIHDMAGEEDSFYSLLKDEGYDVKCILRGLGEYQQIRDIYRMHLAD